VSYPEAAYRSEVPAARRFPLVNAFLLGATLLSTAAAGAVWENADPIAHPAVMLRGLPFGLTLITILLVHEAGHYLMCVRHGVSASLPYFVPAPPMFPLVGTFGAFIRIRSRFPNRTALFDIGAAGPWAGFVVALVATAVGLSRSTAPHAIERFATPVDGDGREPCTSRRRRLTATRRSHGRRSPRPSGRAPGLDQA